VNTSIDLVVLVPDLDYEQAIRGILENPRKSNIREISYDVIRCPEHDAGVLKGATELLRNYVEQYGYTVVMLDHDGCGREKDAAEKIEADLEAQLSKDGWTNRCAVIVVKPEIEIWVWSDSREVDRVLGWEASRSPTLREWLRNKGYLEDNTSKANPPKDALSAALKEVRQPRSSSIFRELARKVSFQRCCDRAFVKLRGKLQEWFFDE